MEWSGGPGVGDRNPIGYPVRDKKREEKHQNAFLPQPQRPFSLSKETGMSVKTSKPPKSSPEFLLLVRIGVDLSRDTFHVVGLDEKRHRIFRKKFTRESFKTWLCRPELPRMTVAMESCAGAQWWGSYCQAQGHVPMLSPPHQVKPFATSQKNDFNDAETICEASLRPRPLASDRMRRTSGNDPVEALMNGQSPPEGFGSFPPAVRLPRSDRWPERKTACQEPDSEWLERKADCVSLDWGMAGANHPSWPRTWVREVGYIGATDSFQEENRSYRRRIRQAGAG